MTQSTSERPGGRLALDTNSHQSHRVWLREDEHDTVYSSDENAHEEGGDGVGDTHEIISPSLGRQQTVLASPNTPAVEKVAILNADSITASDEHGFDEAHDEEEDLLRPRTGVSRVDHALELTAEPSQVGAEEAHKRNPSIASSLSKLMGARPRASTAGSVSQAEPQPRKIGPFTFGKSSGSSKYSLNGAMSWFSTIGSEDGIFRTKSTDEPHLIRENSLQDSTATSSDSVGSSSRAASQSTTQPTSPESSGPPRLLRRTTSDTSLVLLQPLSRASSLGDDNRFANVQNQANSRFKAIKDSLADSNIRMPRIPQLPRSLVPPWSESEETHSSKAREQTFRAPVHVRKTSEPGRIKPRSAEAPAAGMNKANAEAHPNFTKAMRHLTGDVVIMGGYRGSVLRSAEAPYRQLWVPIKVGLNLRKVNLELGLEPEDEERSEETVLPSGMLKHIGPIDVSRRLFKRLRSCKNSEDGKLRVWDFGYDWRLPPHVLSRKLINFLERLECNQPGVPQHQRGATVIAHSLGGLITRHACNMKPHLFRGIVYAGVPQTCVNILGPLRSGDDVLLSSRVLTAQVNFTIRTSFALLPLDGKCFIDKETKEHYNVDFFNVDTWEEYCLSPCIARPHPPSGGGHQIVKPTGILESITSVLPNAISGRRSRSNSRPPAPSTTSTQTAPGSSTSSSSLPRPESPGAAQRAKDKIKHPVDEATTLPSRPQAMAPHIDNNNSAAHQKHPPTSPPPTDDHATAVTIPHAAARAYLTRTLASVKKFKQDLAHNASTTYPPMAIIYGKSTPTVYGAYVRGREGIKRSDAYDDLAFASGDGVVLARAAQLPHGYKVARGGVVSSDRGHIALLGDLEAVGRCLLALNAERKAHEAGGESKR